VGRLDAAVVVVTTAVGEERSGCLVGFHSQCSIDPPQYAVWLSKANHTFGLVDRASHLAVHVLGPAQRPVAELFGSRTGDDVDKFARCRWSPGPAGMPMLDVVSDWFVGRKVAVIDHGGDHVGVALAPIAVTCASSGRGQVLHLSDVAFFRPSHPA
jgi:flavin reductase (DIM6/NTAB) family NADH-FMN oxidoreductase RutF